MDRDILNNLIELSDKLDVIKKASLADSIDALLIKMADLDVKGWYYYPPMLQPGGADGEGDDMSLTRAQAPYGNGAYLIEDGAKIIFYVPYEAKNYFASWRASFLDLSNKRIAAGEHYISNVIPILEQINPLDEDDPSRGPLVAQFIGSVQEMDNIIDESWGMERLYELIADGHRLGIRGSFIESWSERYGEIVEQLQDDLGGQ
tara:strand:+ start:25325 stop:25936 length:612 start_codon:yes stop_codon:yes gene_type:complete